MSHTPEPIAPHEVAMEALAQTQDTHRQTRALIRELRNAMNTPADLRTVIFDPTKSRDTVTGYGQSIGILNPNSLAVYLGIGGTTPAPGQRGISVAPNTLLVLPVTVGNVELGVDATLLGADTAVVFVLLYETVQPAFLGHST